MLFKNDSDEQPVAALIIEEDVQTRGLELAYTMTSIESSCKAMIREMICSRKTWVILKVPFQFVSEASVDTVLSQMQAFTVKIEEHSV